MEPPENLCDLDESEEKIETTEERRLNRSHREKQVVDYANLLDKQGLGLLAHRVREHIKYINAAADNIIKSFENIEHPSKKNREIRNIKSSVEHLQKFRSNLDHYLGLDLKNKTILWNYRRLIDRLVTRGQGVLKANMAAPVESSKPKPKKPVSEPTEFITPATPNNTPRLSDKLLWKQDQQSDEHKSDDNPALELSNHTPIPLHACLSFSSCNLSRPTAAEPSDAELWSTDEDTPVEKLIHPFGPDVTLLYWNSHYHEEDSDSPSAKEETPSAGLAQNFPTNRDQHFHHYHHQCLNTRHVLPHINKPSKNEEIQVDATRNLNTISWKSESDQTTNEPHGDNAFVDAQIDGHLLKAFSRIEEKSKHRKAENLAKKANHIKMERKDYIPRILASYSNQHPEINLFHSPVPRNRNVQAPITPVQNQQKVTYFCQPILKTSPSSTSAPTSVTYKDVVKRAPARNISQHSIIPASMANKNICGRNTDVSKWSSNHEIKYFAEPSANANEPYYFPDFTVQSVAIEFPEESDVSVTQDMDTSSPTCTWEPHFPGDAAQNSSPCLYLSSEYSPNDDLKSTSGLAIDAEGDKSCSSLTSIFVQEEKQIHGLPSQSSNVDIHSTWMLEPNILLSSQESGFEYESDVSSCITQLSECDCWTVVKKHGKTPIMKTKTKLRTKNLSVSGKATTAVTNRYAGLRPEQPKRERKAPKTPRRKTEELKLLESKSINSHLQESTNRDDEVLQPAEDFCNDLKITHIEAETSIISDVEDSYPIEDFGNDLEKTHIEAKTSIISDAEDLYPTKEAVNSEIHVEASRSESAEDLYANQDPILEETNTENSINQTAEVIGATQEALALNQVSEITHTEAPRNEQSEIVCFAEAPLSEDSELEFFDAIGANNKVVRSQSPTILVHSPENPLKLNASSETPVFNTDSDFDLKRVHLTKSIFENSVRSESRDAHTENAATEVSNRCALHNASELTKKARRRKAKKERKRNKTATPEDVSKIEENSMLESQSSFGIGNGNGNDEDEFFDAEEDLNCDSNSKFSQSSR